MDDSSFETLKVVPFIDIMLAMLAMVLTTATFVATGRIPVSLPQASPMPAEKKADKLLELGRDDHIAFEGERVSREELAGRIADLPPQTSFLIRADKDLPLQSFVEVADAMIESASEGSAEKAATAAGAPSGFARLSSCGVSQIAATSPRTDERREQGDLFPRAGAAGKMFRPSFAQAPILSILLHAVTAAPFCLPNFWPQADDSDDVLVVQMDGILDDSQMDEKKAAPDAVSAPPIPRQPDAPPQDAATSAQAAKGRPPKRSRRRTGPRLCRHNKRRDRIKLKQATVLRNRPRRLRRRKWRVRPIGATSPTASRARRGMKTPCANMRARLTKKVQGNLIYPAESHAAAAQGVVKVAFALRADIAFSPSFGRKR